MYRLLAFSSWNQQSSWTLSAGNKEETIQFRPYIGMNDYTGLANALVSGSGIGDLPPIVSPWLIKEGKLVSMTVALAFVGKYLKGMDQYRQLKNEIRTQSVRKNVTTQSVITSKTAGFFSLC